MHVSYSVRCKQAPMMAMSPSQHPYLTHTRDETPFVDEQAHSSMSRQQNVFSGRIPCLKRLLPGGGGRGRWLFGWYSVSVKVRTPTDDGTTSVMRTTGESLRTQSTVTLWVLISFCGIRPSESGEMLKAIRGQKNISLTEMVSVSWF